MNAARLRKECFSDPANSKLALCTLHCCGQDILHVTQKGCKTTNFGCFNGNTANKEFCTVQIDLQNVVVILFLCFATLQNKLATAVLGGVLIGHAFATIWQYNGIAFSVLQVY